MTVAQTNQSLLKLTNRQLQLELAQCKVYISELEQQLEKVQAQNAKLSPTYDKAKNAFEDPDLKEQKISEVFTEEDFQ